jgi:hypothetical protein
MARTTTTTREQTYNKRDNYTLKMFIWHLYNSLHNIEFLAMYAYMRIIETRFVVKKLKMSDLKFVQSLKT